MITNNPLLSTAITVAFAIAIDAAHEFDKSLAEDIYGSPFDEPYSGEDYHEFAARLGY